jgi:8-oxo-dGTP diphosphatase
MFVLPSTSPANAAVPYGERLRWFEELAGRLTGRPLRPGVRALVVDPADRLLLVRFAFDDWDRTWWAPPGGGLEPGETHIGALARELVEEVGLTDVTIGPCVWVRQHWFDGLPRYGGQEERIFLVRTESFEPAGSLREVLAQEGVVEVRWWTPAELASSREVFAPRRLPQLLPQLLRGTLPVQPIDVGV